MKKIWIAVFFLPLFAFAVADWVTVPLDDKVSVDFPVAPEKKDMGGNPSWIADPSDDTRCMTTIIDFQNFGMDSAQVAEEMNKDQSFQDFKNGVLSKIPGGTIVTEKKTTTNGYTTFEFVINMHKSDTAALGMMYNRNIIVGAKLYTLNFFERPGHAHESVRNRFLQSFKVH